MGHRHYYSLHGLYCYKCVHVYVRAFHSVLEKIYILDLSTLIPNVDFTKSSSIQTFAHTHTSGLYVCLCMCVHACVHV
jgi:hypothetical protein